MKYKILRVSREGKPISYISQYKNKDFKFSFKKDEAKYFENNECIKIKLELNNFLNKQNIKFVVKDLDIK